MESTDCSPQRRFRGSLNFQGHDIVDHDEPIVAVIHHGFCDLESSLLIRLDGGRILLVDLGLECSSFLMCGFRDHMIQHLLSQNITMYADIKVALLLFDDR